MSLEAIRVDIVTKAEAVRATFSGGYSLVVEYDNQILVDTKTQTNPFLTVEVKLLDAAQVDLSMSPLHRFWGSIVLKAAMREGEGSRKSNLLLEHFYKGMHKASFGKVRTLMSTIGPVENNNGWEYRTVLIPFWSDQPS